MGDDDILKNSSKEILRKKAEDLKLRKDRLREVEKEHSALHEKFDMGKLQIESMRYFIRGTFQKIHSQEDGSAERPCRIWQVNRFLIAPRLPFSNGVEAVLR